MLNSSLRGMGFISESPFRRLWSCCTILVLTASHVPSSPEVLHLGPTSIDVDTECASLSGEVVMFGMGTSNSKFLRFVMMPTVKYP
jgi:hypothetical protein